MDAERTWSVLGLSQEKASSALLETKMNQKQINRVESKDRTDASMRQKKKGKKRRIRAERRINKMLEKSE
jgi:hypothetical protein